MISYDEYGNSINQFLNSYNKLKSSFSEFKNSIKSEACDNNKIQIKILNETEKDISIEFADRKFLIKFSIVNTNGNGFFGKIIFSEELKFKYDDRIVIDQIYFDLYGNAKEYPMAKYSEITKINLKNHESSTYLLKYWLVKFIECNIEKSESA